LVETTPVAGMRTLRTLDAGERLDLHLAFENDEACVRVRAVGRDGVGPASTPVCLP
jgi:hypothetical protein